MAQHQNNSLKAAFSDNLKRARGKRSQAEFARALGIASQQTYQRYENGQLVPSGEVLHQIASKIGVSIDALLSKGKQEIPAAVSVGNADIPIPWGFELEQSTQMVTALTLFMEVMTSKQLARAMQLVVKNHALSEKAKVLLTRLVSEWFVMKLESEEFERLSPEEKAAQRKHYNETMRLKAEGAAEAQAEIEDLKSRPSVKTPKKPGQ